MLAKLSLLLFITCLHAKTVNIISPFCPETWPGSVETIKKKHTIQCVCPEHANLATVNLDYAQTDKMIFFDLNLNQSLHPSSVKKNVLFQVEARYYDERYFSNFDRIYTWDDNLVDNVRFFKFYYPYLCEMKEDRPRFEDKKFMCMVASNWVPHRLHALNYFSSFQEFLDIYGKNLPLIFEQSKMYKGQIPGHHSCEAKFEVMKNYKFCLCFENTLNTQGYITEKIFACFRSGCVPIYWGASNITSYIPENCFIDIRNFSSYDELVNFLFNIDKHTYEEYLQNICIFLASSDAKKFSIEYLDKILCEAIEYE